MKRRPASVLLGLLVLAACDGSDSGVAGESGVPLAPVTVYASAEQAAGLREEFSAFTAETRIPVTLKIADSESNVSKVIANLGAPAADVLVTPNVTDIWRAADEGALRPLTSRAFTAVPPVLKDPDRTWVAIGVRYAIIGVAPGTPAAPVGDYGDLSSSELRGKVCLSSSTLPVNRSLIAMLIEDIGIKPAERMVRAWVRNLAASPYATEAQLVNALRSGICGYGIVSSSVDLEGLSKIAPKPLYIDIDGIGVARHATQAESAQTLVHWMLNSSSLPDPRSSNGKNIGLAGWRDEDVRLLVERAGYR